MAIGDEALQAGYTLVPDSGEDGKVKYGAREINRTRDFVGWLKNNIPTNRGAYRTATGITSGSGNPVKSAGANGDIYFKIL